MMLCLPHSGAYHHKYCNCTSALYKPLGVRLQDTLNDLRSFKLYYVYLLLGQWFIKGLNGLIIISNLSEN